MRPNWGGLPLRGTAEEPFESFGSAPLGPRASQWRHLKCPQTLSERLSSLLGSLTVVRRYFSSQRRSEGNLGHIQRLTLREVADLPKIYPLRRPGSVFRRGGGDHANPEHILRLEH